MTKSVWQDCSLFTGKSNNWLISFVILLQMRCFFYLKQIFWQVHWVSFDHFYSIWFPKVQIGSKQIDQSNLFSALYNTAEIIVSIVCTSRLYYIYCYQFSSLVLFEVSISQSRSRNVNTSLFLSLFYLFLLSFYFSLLSLSLSLIFLFASHFFSLSSPSVQTFLVGREAALLQKPCY